MSTELTWEEVQGRINALAGALTHPDPLVSAIKGHLYIEGELQYFIERKLASPRHLPKKLDYEIKLALALALGLPSLLEAPLTKIGWLRNKFAHDLGFSITKQVVDSIYQSLGGLLQVYAKEFYTGMPPGRGMPKKFSGLDEKDRLAVMVMSLYSVTAMSVYGSLGEITLQDRPLTRSLGLISD